MIFRPKFTRELECTQVACSLQQCIDGKLRKQLFQYWQSFKKCIPSRSFFKRFFGYFFWTSSGSSLENVTKNQTNCGPFRDDQSFLKRAKSIRKFAESLTDPPLPLLFHKATIEKTETNKNIVKSGILSNDCVDLRRVALSKQSAILCEK